MSAMISAVAGWVLAAAMVIPSLALHEWAHIFAVRFLGGKIEHVGIFPLGFTAKARRLETLRSWERYVIYAAGPAANLLIAVWAAATSYISYTGVPWLDLLAFYNFVLCLFNLTPVLPLDGGRLALQFLGNRIGILRASRFIKRLGIFISYAFILIGIIQVVLFPYNITLLCAGLYLKHRNKNLTAELHAAFHLAMEGKKARARTLPTKEISVAAETQVKHAVERLTFDYFIVFRIDGKKLPLHEQSLIKHIFTHGTFGTVGDAFADGF